MANDYREPSQGEINRDNETGKYPFHSFAFLTNGHEWCDNEGISALNAMAGRAALSALKDCYLSLSSDGKQVRVVLGDIHVKSVELQTLFDEHAKFLLDDT